MRVMEIMVPATPLMKAASFATCMISTAPAWLVVDTRACCVCLHTHKLVTQLATMEICFVFIKRSEEVQYSCELLLLPCIIDERKFIFNSDQTVFSTTEGLAELLCARRDAPWRKKRVDVLQVVQSTRKRGRSRNSEIPWQS